MKPLLFQLCKKRGLVDSEFRVQPPKDFPTEQDKLLLGSVIYELARLGIVCGIVLCSEEMKLNEEYDARAIVKKLAPHVDWDKCFNDIERFSDLTPCMQQVLFFIPHYTSLQMAKLLNKEESTIKELRQNIRDRTGFHKKKEIVAFVRRLEALGVDTTPCVSSGPE